MGTQDKYIKRKGEEVKSQPNEVKISNRGPIQNPLTYAGILLVDKKEPRIVIKASGPAITRACTLANLLVQRILGLSQIFKISNVASTDVYDPIEEGLDVVTIPKILTILEITLVYDKEATQEEKSHYGYHAPLPESEIQEFPKPAEISRQRKANRNQKRKFEKKEEAKPQEKKQSEEQKSSKARPQKGKPRQKKDESKNRKESNEGKASKPKPPYKKKGESENEKGKEKNGQERANAPQATRGQGRGNRRGNRARVNYVAKKSE